MLATRHDDDDDLLLHFFVKFLRGYHVCVHLSLGEMMITRGNNCGYAFWINILPT